MVKKLVLPVLILSALVLQSQTNDSVARNQVSSLPGTCTPRVIYSLTAGSTGPYVCNNDGVSFTGPIGTVNTPTPGSTCTFTANSGFCILTTTGTVTVPVPAAGYQFCAFNDDNVSTVITLSAIGSSARYENTARTAYGTAGTGTFISGGAVGDFVCLVGRDSTHYLTVSSKGTWTAN